MERINDDKPKKNTIKPKDMRDLGKSKIDIIKHSIS